MKTMKLNQSGFGHLAVLFLLVFFAVAGFAGYKVVTMNKASNAASSVVLAPKVPAHITTKADLTATVKALDAASGQVNGSLNDNTLNGDLNDML